MKKSTLDYNVSIRIDESILEKIAKWHNLSYNNTTKTESNNIRLCTIKEYFEAKLLLEPTTGLYPVSNCSKCNAQLSTLNKKIGLDMYNKSNIIPEIICRKCLES